MSEELPEGEGPDNLSEPPSFFPLDHDQPMREHGDMGELIEVQIDGIFQSDAGGSTSQFVMVSDEARKLPILIGGFEASAITMPLEGHRPDRPMTHDLIRNILDRLDVRLDRVVIDDLWNGIYYAKLYIRTGKEEMEIDSRPSDAIALAVRFDASIFVADAILDQGLTE